MIDRLNIVIIGNGHYTSGLTSVEGIGETDKDLGVILPSILELRRQGMVDQIFLAARQGSKFNCLKKKLQFFKNTYGWDVNVKLFPSEKITDDKAYQEALATVPKPAAAIIATPDHLHKRMIGEAFEQKCHVLTVKPAVTNLADLKEIIALQDKYSVLCFVDYHKVYDDANLIIKQNIENNSYGRIHHIFTKMTQRRIMLEIFKNWLGDNNNNVNHYLGSHYIHLVGFITGAAPVNVRATCQYGVAKTEYGLNTPDLIETQIVWRAQSSEQFISYHVAGWIDPLETAGMTYQELHMLTERGHISSDQRYRGLEWTLSRQGRTIINPYFFDLHRDLDGSLDLEGRYGFKSIKSFLKAAIAVENGENIDKYEKNYPTVKESRNVTAILQAADESLAQGSVIVDVQ